MTSTTVRNGEGHPFPGGLKEIIISCDELDCTVAVNNTEIQAGGGLKAMGWTVSPYPGQLRHYCPDHPQDSKE